MKEIRLSPYIKKAILEVKDEIKRNGRWTLAKYGIFFEDIVRILVKRDIEDMEKPIKLCYRKRCFEVWNEQDLEKAIMFLLWNYKLRL